MTPLRTAEECNELRVTVLDSQTIKAKNTAPNDSNNCLNNKTKKINNNQVSNNVQKFRRFEEDYPYLTDSQVMMTFYEWYFIFSVLTLENI